MNEIRKIMEDTRSFEPIATLASVGRDLAFPVEDELGFTRYERMYFEGHERHMRTSNGYVEIPGIEGVVSRKQREVFGQPADGSELACAAHANGILRPAYAAIVKISFEDENLVPSLPNVS